jgi:small multidrug resistance pump
MKINCKAWLWLILAITAEVIATFYLSRSEDTYSPVQVITIILGYGVAYYALTWVMKSLPLGFAYALWSGIGITAVNFINIVWYQYRPEPAFYAGLMLIISGVLIINLLSGHKEENRHE